MKHIFSSLLIILCAFTFAGDPVPNITESNCDNESESVFEAIADNKPLLVIASGYDCGICKSEAPGFAKLADSLTGRVRVWGAMNYRFSSTRVPSCQELDSWNNSYGWDNIYMFNDNNNGTNKAWAQGGYTSFTVIDPRTKEYAYRGTSQARALDSLFSVLERSETVTANTHDKIGELDAYISNGKLIIRNIDQAEGNLVVWDLLGKKIKEENIKIVNSTSEINLNLINKGMHIITFQTSKGLLSKKIIL